MKHKTATLEGALLDAAVLKSMASTASQGVSLQAPEGWSPSTDWREGGPIIERERISTIFYTQGRYESGGLHEVQCWLAVIGCRAGHDGLVEGQPDAEGPTPLIAAMRAYVASKLGEEVELP